MKKIALWLLVLGMLISVSAAHALSIDNTVNPNVTAAYQAGATFVGLVPKLPLEVLNRQLGTPTAVEMSESLMGCQFPVSVYLDDEDSGNTNDLTINGVSYRRQNALLGGFGHPPGAGNGPAGINTLISYCQVPVRQLPRTQLDYMVFSAQEKTELETIWLPFLGTVSLPVSSPICPAGSYGVRLELDTERKSANYLVGGEKALFAPNEVLGTNLSFSRTACNGKPIYYYYDYDNNYPVCDGEAPAGSALSNSGSVLFNMCFVPADPHAATELPTTFEVFDGDGFVIKDAENYIYFARDVGFDQGSGRATFHQDGEDTLPRSSLSFSDASIESRVRRIIEISHGSDITWYLGWSGWEPPIGVAKDGNPPAPPESCFSDPSQGSCLKTFADLVATVLKYFPK